jgi:hypothetical protein
MFSNENSTDFVSVDKKIVAAQHGESVAAAMLFQNDENLAKDYRPESIVEEDEEEMFADK